MGSSSGGSVSSYTYTAAIIAALCNGPIAGIGSMWKSKDKTTLADEGMKAVLGNVPQDLWGYLETKYPDDAVAYPGLAYVAASEISLGDSAELPNLSFEVYGRTMSKTILDAGGDPVWITGGFYITQEYDDIGPLPAWNCYNGDGVTALTAKVIFSGVTDATIEINASGSTFTVTSGEVFDISAETAMQIRVTGSTGIDVTAIYVSAEVTPEISYFTSSVPGKLDADPAEVIPDFLSNPIDGAGFPLGKLGDLSDYSDYCVAAGLLLSPSFTEQKAASEHLRDLLDATNSEAVPSQGLLKIVPYGDMPVAGNGRTYTPDVTPLYYLDDNHFLSTGEDPVVGSRVTSADAFNHVQVEFVNRDKDYNVEIAEAKDQADIEEKGLRTKDVVQMHHICDAEVAHAVAQILLQRTLYVRNTYKFKLSWKYVLLEPMDIVAITDIGLGLNRTPVRIKMIEEDDNDRLEFTVEEIPPGISTAQNFTPQTATGFIANPLIAPGNANPPVMFEPPEYLCAASDRPELWLAASGGGAWGGCEIWISLNGESYGLVGYIYGKCKMGTIAEDLPLPTVAPDIMGTALDTVNSLTIDLAPGSPAIPAANQQDADSRQTLCYVDGELMAYRDASLVAENRYELRYLVRGIGGGTITTHEAGNSFARLDKSILRFAYPTTMIGFDIKVKLVSFNIFGKAKQSLADVIAYDFALTGAGLADKPHTEGDAGVAVDNTAGLTVTYATAFLNPPALSVTIVGASAGLYVDITSQAETGFTLFVRNSLGAGVDAIINWFSQGV